MSKFNDDKNSHRLGVKELVNRNNFNDKMLKYCQRHLPCDLHEACDDIPCKEEKDCFLHEPHIEEKQHIDESVCNSIQENIEFEVKPKLTYKFKKSKSIKW